MKRIMLVNENRYVLVDDEDYLLVKQAKWYIAHKTIPGNIYTFLKNNGRKKTFSLARVIIDAPKNKFVYHMNKNIYDNRKENLAIYSPTLAIWLSKKKKSEYWGITKGKKSFISQIKINNKLLYLGSFKKEKDAALMYDYVVRQVYKKYPLINFPKKSIYPEKIIKRYNQLSLRLQSLQHGLN